jgi:hypothetical protein
MQVCLQQRSTHCGFKSAQDTLLFPCQARIHPPHTHSGTTYCHHPCSPLPLSFFGYFCSDSSPIKVHVASPCCSTPSCCACWCHSPTSVTLRPKAEAYILKASAYCCSPGGPAFAICQKRADRQQRHHYVYVCTAHVLQCRGKATCMATYVMTTQQCRHYCCSALPMTKQGQKLTVHRCCDCCTSRLAYICTRLHLRQQHAW